MDPRMLSRVMKTFFRILSLLNGLIYIFICFIKLMEILSPFIVPSIVNLAQELSYGWQLKGIREAKIESNIVRFGKKHYLSCDF